LPRFAGFGVRLRRNLAEDNFQFGITLAGQFKDRNRRIIFSFASGCSWGLVTLGKRARGDAHPVRAGTERR
jgi:hypothetical protein